MCKFERLSTAIVELSHADNIDEAIHEWEYVESNPVTRGYCVCGQMIMTEYLIQNRITEMLAVVGSTCILNFMDKNAVLVADVARAQYEAVRQPCNRCGVWTKHPEYCKRCEHALEKLQRCCYECDTPTCLRVIEQKGLCADCDREREMKLQRERRHKWNMVSGLINWDMLSSAEYDFLDRSVQWCILHDKKLSDKQRAWLNRIARRYPAVVRR